MSNILSQTQYYGFTLKCLKKSTQESPLLFVMEKMLAKYKAIYVEHTFETDSKGRLHIHGTFMARKSLYCKLFKEKYYTVHVDTLKTVDDLRDWTNYIHSDDDGFKTFYNQIQGEKYMFIDQAPTDENIPLQES